MDSFVIKIGSALFGIFSSLGGYQTFVGLFGNDGSEFQRVGWTVIVVVIIAGFSILGAIGKQNKEGES